MGSEGKMRNVSLRDSASRPQSMRFDRPSDTVPVGDGEMSAPRSRIPDVVPNGWLDRLFHVVLELPLAAGEDAVVEAMVDGVAEILPRYAVGACFVAHGASAGEQTVFRRLPNGALNGAGGVDPTRVFAGFAREHVTPVPSSEGSTLHVASDEDDLDATSAPAAQLVDRAAAALGRALEHARTMESLRASRPDTSAFHARMLQADKLATFGQIAAGLVHELNNPLTSIVAYSDYLIRHSSTPEGATSKDPQDVERLRRISESANRMLRFTRELVGYSRPSSSVVGSVALHRVIDQAVAFCEHVLSAAGVRIERNYGDEMPPVSAVSEQLVQVFVNLLTNASQAAPTDGGQVVVRTFVDGQTPRVVVEVEDNGTGIAPEHLQHVFVPFFTTKGDKNGTGLGLSIVKSILESQGGEIRVESEVGKGTRFFIELPLWRPST
jgi:two-component system NtrC family sensor kinase